MRVFRFNRYSRFHQSHDHGIPFENEGITRKIDSDEGALNETQLDAPSESHGSNECNSLPACGRGTHTLRCANLSVEWHLLLTLRQNVHCLLRYSQRL